MTGKPGLDVSWEGELDGDRLEEMVADVLPLAHAEEPVRCLCDLREVTYVTPVVLAVIRCAFRYAQVEGRLAPGSSLRLPKRSNVARYVMRMDVFQDLTAREIEEDFQRRPATGFVPVADYTDADDAVVTARLLVKSLQLPEDSPAAGPLSIALTEVAENVIFHSGENYGVAAAQGWSKRDLVELAIVDRGLGIPRTLTRKPEHAALSEAVALRRSIDLLVSGLEDPARGQGLWMVSQYVERNQGLLQIYSGEFLLHQRGPDIQVRSGLPRWPGTIVQIQLSPVRELDINDVLERHFPTDDSLDFVDF